MTKGGGGKSLMFFSKSKDAIIIPEQDTRGPKHLIVLHHGLWGNPSHMEPIIKQFNDTFKDNDFYFLNTDTSQGSLTYDGIDVCGERCVDLIIKTVAEINVVKISLIGYSLGGLIVRYVAGRLYHLGYFKQIQPMNFVTLATPNLGTLKPTQYSLSRFYNFLQKSVLTRVGHQFTVTDSYLNDMPLLMIMADPAYDFFKGLKQFKQRVVFANIDRDRSVRFTTASLGSKNPYSKFKHTIIDPKYPAIVTHDRTTPRTPEPWKWSDVKSTATKMVLIPILVPIWFVVAGTALTITYVISKRRQQRIMMETAWLGNGDATDDKEPVLESRDDFDELEGDVEESSTLAASKDIKRIKMLENLNKLKWKKVDVFFDTFNAHGAIMRRKPFHKNESGDAIHYLADHLFIT
jgi:hypothetical protein